jgi:hypothetical protein
VYAKVKKSLLTCGEGPLLSLLHDLHELVRQVISVDDRAAEVVPSTRVEFTPHPVAAELFLALLEQLLHV